MQQRWFVILALLVAVAGADDATVYKIGAGIADITGCVAEIGMMGYANPSQLTGGIHFRLYARAFIVDDGTNLVAFVSADMCMVDQLIKLQVVKELQSRGYTQFNHKNVAISGIHTHSGPGGFLEYVLLQVSTLGFIPDCFEAYVTGIVKSIIRAQDNMVQGTISYTSSELLNASINRSPYAYLGNPPAELEKYRHDTDKKILLVRFDDVDGNPIGTLNWFAVHCTSMNNTNRLISGDNKGYASMLFEAKMNDNALPGTGKFVAAFASTNLGDVSPNTKGPRCQDTGLPCDFKTSTCNGKNELCIAAGPGDNMVESTQIIGSLQYEKAWEMYNSADMKPVSGPVEYIHQYVDMTNQTVQYTHPDTGEVTTGQTCKAALGYSFAAGTIDGPGMFNFAQGTTTSNKFWNTVRNVLKKPSQELVNCQLPKPVLLPTGEINWPYAWHPAIVETQIFRIGNLYILAVPGEFTTMSGRRLRDGVTEVLEEQGIDVNNTEVVISGLTNVYSHYIATYEEYQRQRYEGASTLYGPYTHPFYLQQYKFLAEALVTNTSVDAGPDPPYLLSEMAKIKPGVVFDGTAANKYFGQCVVQPYPVAMKGETVIARFIAGHPRNNNMQDSTYLTVERQINSTQWEIVATDGSWETRFYWVRTNTLLGRSEVDIQWDIPESAEEGTYRIRHWGAYKLLGKDPMSYSGISNSFTVKSQTTRRRLRPSPRRNRKGRKSNRRNKLEAPMDTYM